MDKNTLGHYGWVVISVIIIAILIGLANPFAVALKGNFVGTVNDFGGRMDAALEGMTPTEPKEFVPGLYETGALELYKTQGPDAVANMLIMSYDEMIEEGYITVENGVLMTVSNILLDKTIEKNEYGFYFGVPYTDPMSNVNLVFYEDGSADIYSIDGEFYGTQTGLAAYELGVITVNGGRYEMKPNGNVFVETDFPIYLSSSAVQTGDLILPNDGSITAINNDAVCSCNSLTGITIPSSVQIFGDRAFSDCDNLTEIYYEENSQLTTISWCCFTNMDSITSLDIPNSVAFIGYGAFRNSSNLAAINFSGTIAEWEAITFDYQGTSGDFYTSTLVEYIQCSDGQVPLT